MSGHRRADWAGARKRQRPHLNVLMRRGADVIRLEKEMLRRYLGFGRWAKCREAWSVVTGKY